MFQSVLIANRGEIACRIIRTCRRLGLRTVAVYSDADKGARHVAEADESIGIGAAESSQSYLNAEAIIAAAVKARVDAIHPGYGFLSESTQLVNACRKHGLIWIGPRAEVIEMMGSKIESKRIAVAAGVDCVPGYHGDKQDPGSLLLEAQKIGTPLLIKASAGGGGKGMRRVDDLNDFAVQLEMAKREALRAFGDDRVLIEKLILRPRHLEVQLAGDHHGNIVHLFERECSIQRNYQKIIEEAPAPNLTDNLREKLYAAALKLGKEIAYDSLGTVEFVLEDGSDSPFFLEMNTRLQVEHPVTEMVTGLDLVEWQIRIAAEERLPLTQTEINRVGWAIEARINCEDPEQSFRPEFGVVNGYKEPALMGVRVESGIRSGSSISPHYDSMVAKLIGYGTTRAEAIDRLQAGLQGFEATGIGTNQSLLLKILATSGFKSGRLTTGFLQETFPNGIQVDTAVLLVARCAAALYHQQLKLGNVDRFDYWQQRNGYRFMHSAGRKAKSKVRVQARDEEVTLAFWKDSNWWVFEYEQEIHHFKEKWTDANHLTLIPQQGTTRYLSFAQENDSLVVNSAGTRWVFSVLSELQALSRVERSAAAAESDLRSDMPGIITAIHVKPGDQVNEGDILIVMEAMKLIISLAAPRSGVVAAVNCKQNEIVQSGKILLQLEELEASLEPVVK
jgi:3-methylcrotonyl-CoA carboxylase alpha subunit